MLSNRERPHDRALGHLVVKKVVHHPFLTACTDLLRCPSSISFCPTPHLISMFLVGKSRKIFLFFTGLSSKATTPSPALS